mmetsp:Transcript_10399/g.23727  ORF Transcript_10399/g.23727 Transcript_10399/m.23727 type:complete len:128 (-) Transcript_10399:334-717(-)
MTPTTTQPPKSTNKKKKKHEHAQLQWPTTLAEGRTITKEAAATIRRLDSFSELKEEMEAREAARVAHQSRFLEMYKTNAEVMEETKKIKVTKEQKKSKYAASAIQGAGNADPKAKHIVARRLNPHRR